MTVFDQEDFDNVPGTEVPDDEINLDTERSPIEGTEGEPS